MNYESLHLLRVGIGKNVHNSIDLISSRCAPLNSYPIPKGQKERKVDESPEKLVDFDRNMEGYFLKLTHNTP